MSDRKCRLLFPPANWLSVQSNGSADVEDILLSVAKDLPFAMYRIEETHTSSH